MKVKEDDDSEKEVEVGSCFRTRTLRRFFRKRVQKSLNILTFTFSLELTKLLVSIPFNLNGLKLFFNQTHWDFCLQSMMDWNWYPIEGLGKPVEAEVWFNENPLGICLQACEVKVPRKSNLKVNTIIDLHWICVQLSLLWNFSLRNSHGASLGKLKTLFFCFGPTCSDGVTHWKPKNRVVYLVPLRTWNAKPLKTNYKIMLQQTVFSMCRAVFSQ